MDLMTKRFRIRRRARSLFRRLDTVEKVADSLLEAHRVRLSHLMEKTIISLIVLELVLALI